MFGRIIGILVSIALIVAGLSGDYVLNGTKSSVALVVVGVLFLVWEIFAFMRDKRNGED